MSKRIIGSAICILIMCTVIGCSSKEKRSLKEQAWAEAENYVEWYAKENSLELSANSFNEENVIQMEGTNYTCIVTVNDNTGTSEVWIIDVHKKNNGDWEVKSVGY